MPIAGTSIPLTCQTGLVARAQYSQLQAAACETPHVNSCPRVPEHLCLAEEALWQAEAMADEPDFLDRLHRDLSEQYEQAVVPKIQAAERRRRVMAGLLREVAVQALATFLGGAALAGGAVAMGWIGSDPTMRVYAGVGAFSLVLSVALIASRPLDTAADHALTAKLSAVEALIAQRDRQQGNAPRGSATTPEE